MLLVESLICGLSVYLAVLFVCYHWRRRRLYELAAKLPGPKGLPFIGMGHKFLNGNFKRTFQVITTITKGFESPASVWLGPELIVFVETPETIQIVLNSQHCLDKSNLYKTFSLEKGLVVGGGDTWKAHRKILNPAFSLSVLQKLVPLFNEKSKILSKNMEVELGRKAFDVYAYLSACSLETLLKGTMNMDRDIQGNALQNEYVHSTEISSQVLMKRVVNVIYHNKAFYRMTNLFKLEEKHYHGNMFRIAGEIMAEQQQSSATTKETTTDPSDYESTTNQKKNFIQTLMSSKDALSLEEISDEINTLVAAGHETSALVMSHCLLMIALHPEVQQKVVDELREVFGSADTPVDYASLNKLVYLELVLKEVMRLFPVLPVSGRKASGEFDIGSYTIPAGATIVISAYQVQRNPKYWDDDAHLFKPERFEPESFKKIPPYAYIPFTGGPRICIGWRYGMMFMKTVLANLLRKFEVNSPLRYEELEFELIITLKVVQRCMITLKERSWC